MFELYKKRVDTTGVEFKYEEENFHPKNNKSQNCLATVLFSSSSLLTLLNRFFNNLYRMVNGRKYVLTSGITDVDKEYFRELHRPQQSKHEKPK